MRSNITRHIVSVTVSVCVCGVCMCVCVCVCVCVTYGRTACHDDDEDFDADEVTDTVPEQLHTETEEDTGVRRDELSTIEEEQTDAVTTDNEQHTQAEDTAPEDTAAEEEYEGRDVRGRGALPLPPPDPAAVSHDGQDDEAQHDVAMEAELNDDDDKNNYTEDETTAAEETDVDFGEEGDRKSVV